VGWFKALFTQKKEKTESEKVLEIFGPAVTWAASSWTVFHQSMTMISGVEIKLDSLFPLALEKMSTRLKVDFPILDSKEGEVMIAVIVAKGIEISGTHSKEEVEKVTGTESPF
jgi:hypothetical protein